MTDRADVIVVGGGVVGLCAAHYVRQLGADVVLLERGRLEDPGASHGNAGMIVPSHVVPLAAPGVVAQGLRWLFRRDSPFYVRPRASRALWSWLWRFRAFCTEEHVRAAAPVLRDLGLHSVTLFEELSESGLDFGFRQDGLLLVHDTERGRADDLYKAAVARETGLDVEILDHESLRSLEPGLRGGALGGVYFRQDCHLKPEALALALVRQARREGVRIFEDARVERLQTGGGPQVEVTTRAGAYSADRVVLTAGAWSPELTRTCGYRLPVEPAKGYSLTLPLSPRAPRIPTILSEAKVTLTPMGDRMRFAGTLALAGLDAGVDRKRAASILRVAAAYTPDLEREHLPIWSGFRPCTPDGLPVIGPLPGAANVIVATGHGMLGVTLGPVTGRLVADLVGGTTPVVDLTPVRPDRFR